MKVLGRGRLPAVLGLCLFLPGSLRADRLLLRDGGEYIGTIFAVRPEEVCFVPREYTAGLSGDFSLAGKGLRIPYDNLREVDFRRDVSGRRETIRVYAFRHSFREFRKNLGRIGYGNLLTAPFKFACGDGSLPPGPKLKATNGPVLSPAPVKTTPTNTDESAAAEPKSLWWSLAREYLGGLQVEQTWGRARVASFIRDGGSTRKVAAGRADQDGFRVGLFRGQQSTDWFLRFNPAYFEQKISIKDFRRDIPRTEVTGRDNLETVVTDFESGARVDPRDPNVFSIGLKSSGVDLAGGAALGTPLFPEFISLEVVGGLTLGERRHSTIDLGSDILRDQTWAFLNSYRVGGALNLFAGPFCVQISYVYQAYRDVRFPRDVEFRDSRVVYNEKIEAFERPRVYVEGYNLSHQTLRLSAFWQF